MEGRVGTGCDELRYLRSFVSTSRLPLCNQNHVNLNLQTPVVSHFVLWLWHTRKMWLDGGLIQTRNPSPATTCQTSMKSQLGITSLFSKRSLATSHSKREDFHQQNLFGVSNSSVPGSLGWSCATNTAQGCHWGLTIRVVWRLIISHYHYYRQVSKPQFTDRNSLKGISKSTQRSKSLCQFIGQLWFIIRKCKTVRFQERYSLLDPAGAFQDQKWKST